MLSIRRRATVVLVAIGVGLVSSLAGHTTGASAATSVGACGQGDIWTFTGPLSVFPAFGTDTWTPGVLDRVCASVTIDNNSNVEIAHDGPTSVTDQGGPYVGTVPCLLASLEPVNGILIGGSVAVVGTFVHVMAPVAPCFESLAVGVGGGTF